MALESDFNWHFKQKFKCVNKQGYFLKIAKIAIQLISPNLIIRIIIHAECAKNDELKEKNKGPHNLASNYINRSEIERFDNKLIFNAVNKYNEENENKIKKGYLSEFKEVYVKKEKKGDLNIGNKIDPSRKNKK